MKILKALKYFDLPKNAMNDIQSKASQLIQANSITGTLCFSVHPLDYLSIIGRVVILSMEIIEQVIYHICLILQQLYVICVERIMLSCLYFQMMSLGILKNGEFYYSSQISKI